MYQAESGVYQQHVGHVF